MASAHAPDRDTPSVLIVEDEPDLADLYATWLEDVCSPTAVYDGSEALEAIDENVDVVLLDRRMPGLSGDTVLETIRERNLDCRVAMVTAIEPDFDIVGMGFDDYLVKPVSESELVETIEGLQLRAAYDDQLQEFFALASKKVLLDGEKSDAERKSSQEYARLEDRLAVLRVRIDETVEEILEGDGYRQLVRDLGQESLLEE
ncbi:response regulator transcription factor [Natrarchaeobaculum aegyptiacum]|uniref:DNA-binding protein n=1 Tax=Natrarchaeobaculum aegyptiacum TaxID=745377 RepID=A0A2Z2I175_9EURY|nr:HalX domain-containing protein [Natrarchaeobaculum aegyptiacum]ARS91474.1 DNA-binding protein [Natrarchaeobaculum aegyptiacum]